jgi:hypothetical protein
MQLKLQNTNGEALCISNIQDIFHITIHVIIRFDIFTIGPTYQDKRHIQRGNLQIIRVKIETEVIFNIPASNVHQASWKGKSDANPCVITGSFAISHI